MSKWSNFSIWRGRLPHWRADGVNYYVTFRHRRPLEDAEVQELFGALLKPQGRKWNVEVLCVLPEKTEMVVTLENSQNGEPFELSDVVEKAKSKAGKAIIKKSGERFPPFYTESYDRIVRDEDEMATTWETIVEASVKAGLCEDPEEYQFLWVNGAPTSE